MKHYSRIRAFREDKDMTQAEVAEILHCSQRVYSNYERGDIDIPTEILRTLALLHNTSTDYLLELTDDPSPYPRKARR
ncbi:MAG: helix-turn-helix transcriptional regulator [Oscillospiraceae bacterium]|nr:helix-turn-helix transcriptional regulator [Oscillospiraceae bacterium]